MPQGVVHRRFAVAGRMLQNPQILASSHPRCVPALQLVISHAKTAIGKQVLAEAVVLKSARFSHQLIDDVPIVDGVLVAAYQPRQRLDVLPRVPNFHAISVELDIDFLADQAAVDRVGIAVNVNQAPRVHTHRRNSQAALLPLGRKRPEQGPFFGVPLMTRGVARGDNVLQKPHVLLAAGKVAAATQVQGLVHGRLEVSMRRLAVAVLVRLADVDPLARQAVVFQQTQVPRLKFAFGRQVVDRRGETIAAMPTRHAPQFPQRVLQAVGQGLERFRRAHRHRLPVRVGQHEVIDQVVERLTENRDSQRVHVGEVRSRQIPRVMHLLEHHRAGRAEQRSPLLDTPLERAAVARVQLPRMLALEPVEQRLRLQTRLRLQPGLSQRPQFRQRIPPGAIGAAPLLGAGKRSQRAILACRLLVHSSPPGCHRQPVLRIQIPKQLPYLSIRDHRKPPGGKELRI